MVREFLKHKIREEDELLRQIDKETFVLDRLSYAGNISSILFAPLIDKAFGEEPLDIYSNNIYLYVMDDVVQLPSCLYIVCSKNEVTKRIDTDTIFGILRRISFRYYYDDDNVIFIYKIPEKYKEDYNLILQSRYKDVSSYYKALCIKGGLAFAIVHNNKLLKEQWEMISRSLGDVIEERHVNDLKIEKVIKPVLIVNEERNFPEFIISNETYYAKTKNKTAINTRNAR